MVQRIIILLLCLVAVRAECAQTLVKRSLFKPLLITNCADINATNLCGFDLASAGLPIIATGATTNGQTDFGWSGWIQKGTNYGRFTNLLTGYYQASCWFRCNQFSVNSTDVSVSGASNNAAMIFSLGRNSEIISLNCGVAGDGSMWLRNVNDTLINGGYTNFATISLNKWYYLGLAWRHYVDGTNKKAGQLWFGELGTSPVKLYEWTNTTSSSVLTYTDFGETTALMWSGEITGASVHSLTDFTDVGVPTDINPPSLTRSIFYVNPSTGSDLNSGVYVTNAWSSAAQVVKALRYGGLKGSTIPWVYTSTGLTIGTNIADGDFNSGVMDGSIRGNGDKLLIDTSAGTPLKSSYQIHVYPNNLGVEIGGTNGKATIDGLKVISAPYVQYDSTNFPHIWQTTNMQLSVILFEDKKWMNTVTNSTIAASAAYLESTPGSFYTGTSLLYFHPFGDTDPNTDGKLYERSQHLDYKGTVSPNELIKVDGYGNYVHDLLVYGSPYVNQTNGDVWAGATFKQSGTSFNAVGNCDLRYGLTHVYNSADNDNDTNTPPYHLLFNTVSQQGTPWPGGSIGHIVEYVGLRTNAKAYFIGCNWETNALIGSANGTNTGGEFFTHSATGLGWSNQYAIMMIDNCRAGAIVGGPNSIAVSGGFIITNTHAMRVDTAMMANTIISRTRIDGQLYGRAGAVVTDSILNRTDDLGSAWYASGDWRFRNCTLDGTFGTVSQANTSLMRSDVSAAASFGFTNCIFILPQNAFDVTALFYKSGDTINFDHNVYLANAQGNVNSTNGTEISWAAWQALGKDPNSTNMNPCLDARYRPYAKTPAWNVGAELGPVTDHTGKLFQSRRTAGAYEYVTDNPRFLMFHR